ncbi:hypothetical protein N7530_003962, partial [Penicillium desertorum]
IPLSGGTFYTTSGLGRILIPTSSYDGSGSERSLLIRLNIIYHYPLTKLTKFTIKSWSSKAETYTPLPSEPKYRRKKRLSVIKY